MLTRDIKVVNKLGLHARPATKIVETVKHYKSEITIAREDLEVNAKSIMGVMMLAAECGSTLIVTATGDDAQEALDSLEKLFEDKFDEE